MNIINSLTVRLVCCFLCLQLFHSNIAKAQADTLSTPTTGEYSSNISILLLPGFSTSGPFHAFITSSLTVPLASLPSQDQNYIRVKIYKVASPSEIVNPLVSQQSETIQYFDGLGRQLQTVQTKGSPLGHDIVQPFVYDPLGREAVKYLPYAEQIGNGAYKSAAISTQAKFYSTSGWDLSVARTTAPYSQTIFEASQLNQIVEQGAPGTVWQPASLRSTIGGRTILSDMETNDASIDYAVGFGVKMWSAVPVTGAEYKNRLSYLGSYADGQLYLKITKDENWNGTAGSKFGTTEEYSDKEGHIVLKRTFFGQNNGVNGLSTYYVYDDLGNLSFVLPPGASPDGTAVNQTYLDQFCYQYRYDGKHRLIEKKIPGKGWEYTVYNKLDQPVLTQDSVQRNNAQWMFSKYDALGRVVLNGLYSSAVARTAMEATVNAQSVLWESRQATGNGYTNVAFPQSSVSLYLGIQYYDDYNFPGAATYSYPAGSLLTRGLLTGSQANILGTSNMLLNVNYYDDKGELLKIYKQHYQSGAIDAGNYDEVSNSYTFEGILSATTRLHHNSNSGNTTIANRYDYDHVNRKLRSYEQINSDAEVLLIENSYNEIGQLKGKALNGGLQNTNYAYNERGWLKNSTSSEFSFQLNYQDGTTPQYNGNISGQMWGAGSVLANSFNYSYNEINMLLSGTSSGMSEIVTYDRMGNIQTLNRDGVLNSYIYMGNQLTSTTNTGTYQYDGNGNTILDGRLGQSIVYNTLNLPAAVAGLNLSYLYDSEGDKLRKTVGTNITDYVSGIQYTNGVIETIQTEAGLARKNGANYSYEYNLTDHLGNVRYTFHKSPINGLVERLQNDDYYPFGLRKSGSPVSLTNKYLYNGKELQDELGQYDYGARFYDPIIARWNVVDPLAEKHPGLAPYNYVLNNPMSYIDPLGLDTIKVTDNTTTVRPMVDSFTSDDGTVHLSAMEAAVVVQGKGTVDDETSSTASPEENSKIDWRGVGEASMSMAGGSAEILTSLGGEWFSGGLATPVAFALGADGVTRTGLAGAKLLAAFHGNVHARSMPGNIGGLIGSGIDNLRGNKNGKGQQIGGLLNDAISVILNGGIGGTVATMIDNKVPTATKALVGVAQMSTYNDVLVNGNVYDRKKQN
ncbi:DUF6443 domain-containing protein [Pedobacter sp. L105]|uniref:DUF6443 domain-containing protein n=1 Tax=Pedobacter sp. L105 TaxID=1641871 RepID=UPI00131E68E3|nr:DUF6443 domain-containing protein [Pedobacter sp. L105]